MMLASLPMYERPETREAHDRYWTFIKTALNERGINAPPCLTRPTDAFLGHWRSPELLLSQTCGYPYRTELKDFVRVVGTPDYRVEGCPPGYYRSVLICRAEDTRKHLKDFDRATLAFNDSISQSGYIAPMLYARKSGIALRPTRETGSHRSSFLCVANGQAEIAAIDAVTWSVLEAFEQRTDQVRILDVTDPTPGLPYITACKEQAGVLFESVETAISRLSDRDRKVLRLYGLVKIAEDEYHAMAS
jgi:ABC-type phosphate/phosphonate transport system substrate-binding protein